MRSTQLKNTIKTPKYIRSKPRKAGLRLILNTPDVTSSVLSFDTPARQLSRIVSIAVIKSATPNAEIVSPAILTHTGEIDQSNTMLMTSTTTTQNVAIPIVISIYRGTPCFPFPICVVRIPFFFCSIFFA